MRKNTVILISIMILLILFLYIKLQPDTPYDKYRAWFDEEIASVMDGQLKRINKKITTKQMKSEDYVELAAMYEKLFTNAMKKEEPNGVHQHLILYLKYRMEYYQNYIQYFNHKDQTLKAQLNNVYDEGNIEYQLYLDDLQKFAKEHNEKFDYPFILY